MQTFLPYQSFELSAQCLDYRRLGKQRVEALQILQALERKGGAWYNHPATKMWMSYENALKHYHNVCIEEWVRRRYKNNMMLFQVNVSDLYNKRPSWLGDEKFHASHRSNLLRKDPKYYGQFGWTEPTDLPYVWPTHNET